MSLTAADIKVLKADFPPDCVGVKVQSVSKDKSRAMLVKYLQHTDVQDRIDSVDPAWTAEVTATWDKDGAFYVRMKMTIKGVSRENVGEGDDPKSAASDALKRCAMLFGVGRYLYDQDRVWIHYDENRDRNRVWTVADYESLSKTGKTRGQNLQEKTKTDADDLKAGDYTIPFGKLKGTAIRNAGAEALTESIRYWENRSQADGRPLTGEPANFVRNAKAYLGETA